MPPWAREDSMRPRLQSGAGVRPLSFTVRQQPITSLAIIVGRTPMPLRLRLFFSALIVALLLIPATALYRELSSRSDRWWTPPPMAPSLSESQDRVEIYVRGKLLGALLEARQLSVADGAGPSVLGADDIRLRVNNWDRVRVDRKSTRLNSSHPVISYAGFCL